MRIQERSPAAFAVLIGVLSAAVAFLVSYSILRWRGPDSDSSRSAQAGRPADRPSDAPDVSSKGDTITHHTESAGAPPAAHADPRDADRPAAKKSYTRIEVTDAIRRGTAFDPDSTVAEDARTLLSTFEIQEIAPSPEDVLRGIKSINPDVRAMSAMFLPYIGVPWLEVESAYKSEQEPYALVEFLRAFGHMPESADALELLCQRATCDEAFPRQVALECLGYRRCDRSAAILVNASRDPRVETRVSAYEALAFRAREDRSCLEVVLAAARGELEPWEADELHSRIARNGLLRHLPPGTLQNLESRIKRR